MALEGILSGVGVHILKKLGSQASECLGMVWGLNNDLKKLRSNVSSIQAILCDAEQRQIKGNDHSLTDWLEKLGEVYYDVEDVLDEISTETLRREVMMRGKNAKQVRIFFSNSNQLAFHSRITCQIKKINERLDVIFHEKNKFHFNANAELKIQNNSSHPFRMGRETHSSLIGEKVIGRDDEIDHLRKLLLAEDEKVIANVSFIAIVGMGGIGKTTLAKALYNDKQVSDCFTLRIWIWISNYQFDINTILKKLIESATGKNPMVEGREALKIKLQTMIEGKKYLLVMDDVWNENENEWENLKNLLMFGARGSKVLITKRDSKVAPEVEKVHLKDLPDDPSWLLFKEVTFKKSDLESTNQNLIQLGKEISKKCGGIPLVIRHIGRLLYGKTSVEDWEFIKDSKLLNVTRKQSNNDDDHVILTLKLSYNYLPPNLKQCFAYTSLFPKGYEISSKELIRQWMAQGFIESSNGGKSMEDMGKDYLNELCWRFFYEISSDDIVCMHDMMRNLAREVAGKKLYVRGDSKDEYVVCEQTRHISFDYKIESWEEVLTKLRQAKGLRTLLLLYGKVTVSDKLFSYFPRLRVLQISKMSKSMRRLRHLRYLNLVGSSYVESVPNYITELHNLQTLNLARCFHLKELPRDISNLVNLRHLLLYPDMELLHTPEGLAKLCYLQTLTLFVFDCKSFNKLREFNELNCFIQELRITGLEQLRFTPSKANLVNLKNKKEIQCLILEWKLGKDKYEGESDETILEGLEPYPNVKDLSIEGYCGVGLPNWMSTLPLNDLTGFNIINCHRLQHLNQICHLQVLKYLRLIGLRALMSLSEWIGTLTSLENLRIHNCPKLVSLPEEMQQLKSLKEFYIRYCPQLEERCKEGGEDWPNISHLPHFDYWNSTPLQSSDDESEEKGKMKDCITNLHSLFLTCGYLQGLTPEAWSA